MTCYVQSGHEHSGPPELVAHFEGEEKRNQNYECTDDVAFVGDFPILPGAAGNLPFGLAPVLNDDGSNAYAQQQQYAEDTELWMAYSGRCRIEWHSESFHPESMELCKDIIEHGVSSKKYNMQN